MIICQVKNLTQTGTVKELTHTYKELCLCAPSDMAFDTPATHLMYYDTLKLHMMRHVNLDQAGAPLNHLLKAIGTTPITNPRVQMGMEMETMASQTDVDQCPIIQVPSSNLVLYKIARHPNKLMSYPFCFQIYTRSALLDSGADYILVNSNIVNKFKLATNPLQIKNIVLADKHYIAVTWETTPFSISLENLHSTIQGPIINSTRFDVVLGLDWLRRNNPHVDWITSALIIKQEGINHQIYPETLEQLLRDHVFLCITETQEKKEKLKAIVRDHIPDYNNIINTCQIQREANETEIISFNKSKMIKNIGLKPTDRD
ncbi:hypothetical protein DSO57_1010779 [Entomophthora muscae]|uniref:Uncharacterized protein n=1 Tax=Entomophthora muscae TaxID=34485 RepID=A0ACC2UG30_9FUNG|nr:hypothetical protein DSO57_1010779 [Entomophthora muscae]